MQMWDTQLPGEKDSSEPKVRQIKFNFYSKLNNDQYSQSINVGKIVVSSWCYKEK